MSPVSIVFVAALLAAQPLVPASAGPSAVPSPAGPSAIPSPAGPSAIPSPVGPSAIPSSAGPSAGPNATAAPSPAPPYGPVPAPAASAAPATALPVIPPAKAPGPAASVSAAPSAAPSTAPSTSATPNGPPASASPIPATSPSLAPTPLPYNYRFVPHQPEGLTAGAPQILAVFLNERKLRSRGPINIKVETNAEVVKVVSRSNGREGAIPRVRPGEFEATSVLPKIPFIAAGMTVDLEFIATSADGRKATVRVPVRLD